VVHDEDLSHSLATLSFKVERRLQAEHKAAAEFWAKPHDSHPAVDGDFLDACAW